MLCSLCRQLSQHALWLSRCSHCAVLAYCRHARSPLQSHCSVVFLDCMLQAVINPMLCLSSSLAHTGFDGRWHLAQGASTQSNFRLLVSRATDYRTAIGVLLVTGTAVCSCCPFTAKHSPRSCVRLRQSLGRERPGNLARSPVQVAPGPVVNSQYEVLHCSLPLSGERQASPATFLAIKQ